MEQIRIQALIAPAKDEECRGDFVAFTTYDICGQGGSLREARDSAVSVVQSYLSMYARQSAPLPQPRVQLETIDAVRNYFGEEIPSEANIVVDQLDGTPAGEGLPELTFEFYKVQ